MNGEQASLASSTTSSLADCIHDILNLTSAGDSIDFLLSAIVVLHGYWGLIWGYHQLISLYNSHEIGETTNQLMITSRQHELSQILKRFRRNAIGPCRGRIPKNDHTHSRTADYVFPRLNGKNCSFSLVRKALRSRVAYFPGSVPGSKNTTQSRVSGVQAKYSNQQNCSSLGLCAISVYHASLALWSYGLIHRAFAMSDGQDI
jgi:hypothetical protein